MISPENILLNPSPPILRTSQIETPLGEMMAIADETRLYLLEFVNYRGLEYDIERLKCRTKAAIIPGTTASIRSIEKELKQYFEGTLQEFKTPLFFFGTPFQQQVWKELRKIPFGETKSYADIAAAIGRPAAVRAVANANASNLLAIVIPCHRVINTNGKAGGYGGGIGRKTWLLLHECGAYNTGSKGNTNEHV